MGSRIAPMKSILKNHRAKSQAAPAAVPPSATPASSEPSAAPPKYTPRGGKKERILVAVKDNRIDFQAMSSDSSKALNDLMHEPDVQAQFGIGPLTQGFDPQHCKRIYQALGTVFSGLARSMKWPNEAADHLRYTDQEQEELAKPTASVLDELAPKWLRENQALASLLLVFGAMTQNKLREAAAIAIDVKRRQAAAASSAGHDGGGDGATAAVSSEPAKVRVPIAIVPPDKANGAATDQPVNFGGGGVGPRM